MPFSHLNKNERQALEAIADDEGHGTDDDSLWGMVEQLVLSSVQPGACLTCHAVTSRCEPDMRDGWCHNCEDREVQSLGTLSGLV